jgi:MFS transporter, FSR family, fosmidomycin resistance protein
MVVANCRHSGKMTRDTHTQPLLWGLLHCLNDFTAGYMLANYTYTHTYANSFLLIVVYAVIGFGGQLPVGFWLDYKKVISPFAQASFVLLACCAPAYIGNATVGIILSGIASAFVHVTGGAVCLQVHQQKSGPLALFTAPGVLGLTLGGAIGSTGHWVLFVVLILIVAIAWLVFSRPFPAAYNQPKKKETALDIHDWVMLGILLVMCFRSFLFDIINHIGHTYQNGILIIGVSAFVGKIIGGFVADAIGWKKYVYISMPLALLLFQFGKESIIALGVGIACLQSSVPVTLMLICRSLPLYPATAAALSLGTSVALAGLPLFLVSSNGIIHKWFANHWITSVFYVTLFSITGIVCYAMQRKTIKAAGI